MVRARAALVSVAVALLVGRRASADTSARLVYIRDAVAEAACPDETALRRAIEARLGYDPFLPWGSATVVVRFAREGAGFVANVEMVTGSESKGARTLRSDDPGCAGLVDATALAVSIALDAIRPPAAPAPPPTEAPPPPLTPIELALPPTAEVPPASAASEPVDSRARLRPVAGLDALFSTGSAPSVATGLTAWGRLQSGHWSAGVEARADLPSSGPSPIAGTVSTWLLAGGLAPCFHLGPAFGCALGELGWLHGDGSDVRYPSSGAGLFAAVGPRIGVEVPLSAWLSLRLRADLLASLSRSTVMLDGATAWHEPQATGTLGAGFAVRFP